MQVAIIYNKDSTGVINQFGMQNKEVYNPKTVKLVAESLEKEGHNVRIAEGNMYIIEMLEMLGIPYVGSGPEVYL